MRPVLLALSGVLAPSLAYHLAPVACGPASAGLSSVRAVLDVGDDAIDACLMLPADPFPGAPPKIVGGEMELQELEDDMESRTQVFLNPDGTVELGATDGPPPLDFCGLWQCGANSFQMVLRRVFSTDKSIFPDPNGPKYAVTRVYAGSIDPTSTGVALIEGRMAFYNQDSTIGYFVLDANVEAEMSGDTEDVGRIHPTALPGGAEM